MSQVVTLVAVVVPPLGLLAAMGLLWGVGFHWIDARPLRRPLHVCAFGTTIGFHRYFTHKRLRGARTGEGALAILGCMTMQGPLTQWVTDHRKHHALSDKPGDPHSPHVGHGTGRRRARAASSTHTSAGCSRPRGWSRAGSTARISTRTGWSARSTALYLLWVVLTLGIPFAIGYAVGGTWQAGVEGLVWGGLIRIFATSTRRSA